MRERESGKYVPAARLDDDDDDDMRLYNIAYILCVYVHDEIEMTS